MDKATQKQIDYIKILSKGCFASPSIETIEEKMGCTFETLTKSKASEVIGILSKPSGHKEFFK